METISPTSKPRSYFAQIPFADEKETLDSANTMLLEAFGKPIDPVGTGIYLISSNAGFYSSVAFWKEVLDKGPGLANPERFPWTLANAPCGAIARAFGIQGPNYTFNGSAIDLPVLLEQIDFDLSQQLISCAWLVAIDFGAFSNESTSFAVLVLTDHAEVSWISNYVSSDEFGTGGLASEKLGNLLMCKSSQH